MKKTNQMKKIILLAAIYVISLSSNAQIIIDEGYDDVFNLPDHYSVNASDVPNGDWFQGNPAVFESYDGDPNSYIGVNFEVTTGSTVDMWGITPRIGYKNGDIVSFYTRTVAGSTHPDRLELRIDPEGTEELPASGDPGAYTNLLLSINPDLEVGGYPEEWTLYTITISGLPAGITETRLAFRYWVTDGGPNGSNSNYIGLDRFVVESVVLGVEDFDIEGLVAYPNPTTNILTIEAASVISSIEVMNVLGQTLHTETLNTNKTQIDLSAFPTGNYFIRVTVENTTKVMQIIKQ